MNCIKCKADLTKPGLTWFNIGKDGYCVGCFNCVKCSFCHKKLTSECHSSPDKPGIIACEHCHSELVKPTDYDLNRKAYCLCGKTSRPA